ncbi:MAG: hydroxymethylbilane synthase [Thermoguttaceae bacterium]|nr:hydroxymethylbilane synthase [Thermoguttaceae bacterium]
MKTIRLGTRPSELALWQANWTREALEKNGANVKIVKIATSGDVDRSEVIVNIGAQGVFTKEIQRALLNNEIDVAVHSLKDLPIEKIPGLRLVAAPERADCRDAFVSNKYASIDELPVGAVLGTSSMRRKSMALRYAAKLYPDAKAPVWDVRDIRGNVGTRLRKLDDGEYDALVLASAGLERLDAADRITSYLERPDFLPAVGQGALGLETRDDDPETIKQVEKLIDRSAFLSVLAERALLAELQGGCLIPVGAYGRRLDLEDDFELLALDAQILSFDGLQSFSTTSVQIFDPNKFDGPLPFETQKKLAEMLGKGAARALLDQGATELVDEIRRVRCERSEQLRKRTPESR